MESEGLLIAIPYFVPVLGTASGIGQSEPCFKATVQRDNSDRDANFFIHSTPLLLFFPIKANATETVIKPGLGPDCLLF